MVGIQLSILRIKGKDEWNTVIHKDKYGWNIVILTANKGQRWMEYSDPY